MSTTRLFVALLLVAGFAGCSGDKPTAVHGKVTLKDGKPAVGATVYFQSSSTSKGASGTVGDDGVYRLTTAATGDGAPPGAYKVAVYHPQPKDSSQPQTKELFHSRYESAEKSGLQYTVKPGDNQFDIVLDKP